MQLRAKISLFSLTLLIMVVASIVLVGTLVINDIVYELNTRLLLVEIANIRNRIEHGSAVLQRAGVAKVESYVRRTQEQLLHGFESYTFGKTGSLVVVSEPREVLFDKYREAGGTVGSGCIDEMFKKKRGSIECEHDGKRRFWVFDTFPQWNWLIALSITTDEMFEIRTEYLREVSLVALGILVANIVLSSLFVSRLVRRIERTLACMRKVENGDLTARVHPIASGDEIGRLQAGLNAMIARIEERTGQRDRAEESLRQAEEKYRSIFENAVEGIFQSSPEGTLLAANPALARIYGYDSPEEFMDTVTNIGHQVYVSPERRHEFIRLLEQEKVVREFEAEFYRKDGSTIWASINARSFYDEARRQILFEGFIQDITQRTQSEERIRQQNEFLNNVLESLTHPLYVIDATTYEIIRANSVAGLPPSSGAWTCYSLTHRQSEPCNSAGHPCPVEEVRRTRNSMTVEHVHYDKDGYQRTVEIHAYPILDEEGKVSQIIEYSIDVTERKHLEEQLRQASKMEAIGQLAGGIAHDFNNLLTAIMGYSSILLQQIPKSEPYRQKVVEISVAAERAAGLTRELLAFSRKQVLDVRVLDLNGAVAEFGKILGRLIGENIEVATVLDPSLGQVKADPGQIQQILMNLAINARDAMSEGGKLTVETRNAVLDQEYTRANPEVRPGSYVMFSVSDNGVGMDAQTLSRVFDPFFTTKEKGKGTGLGLSTVYGIVKQHEGHISVYSEPGHGTIFKVYLPRVQEVADQTPEPLPTQPGLVGKETVLVVEDEDLVRDLACEALQMLGYSVLRAGDPDQALDISSQYEGPIHLLLTDVVLPRMDGRTLFIRLTSQRPATRALYVSGYTEDFIVHHGVLHRGVHFLQKPFTLESLAIKVREVLDEPSP